ncbi:MAG TPA: adenylyltransferase/cytidyltransferase family protein [Nevskiaceae bacterium]|nr:adenylyltransferase/cytidyltransferase family protein [Nevskiaceae bacterium]
MNTHEHLKKKKHLVKIKSVQHLAKTGKSIFEKPKYAFFGSFDPFTKGHFKVYTQAVNDLQEEVAFVIVKSLFKNNPTFSLEDREAIIKSYVTKANVYYARDYYEIKKLKVRSVKIIKGRRDPEDEAHTNFVFDFYGIPKQKLHQVNVGGTYRNISSRTLKELIKKGELETAAAFANDFTIQRLKSVL